MEYRLEAAHDGDVVGVRRGKEGDAPGVPASDDEDGGGGRNVRRGRERHVLPILPILLFQHRVEELHRVVVVVRVVVRSASSFRGIRPRSWISGRRRLLRRPRGALLRGEPVEVELVKSRLVPGGIRVILRHCRGPNLPIRVRGFNPPVRRRGLPRGDRRLGVLEAPSQQLRDDVRALADVVEDLRMRQRGLRARRFGRVQLLVGRAQGGEDAARVEGFDVDRVFAHAFRRGDVVRGGAHLAQAPPGCAPHL